MLTGSLFSRSIFSVSEVTGYIRVLIEENEDLQDIWVQGEISNLSFPASGHIYFTLKDEGAALRCVIWKWMAQYLHFRPQDGMAVDVHGKFSVYEKGGQYQFYVDSMRQQGEGRLFQEFLELKSKLETEGLFAEELKKPIPAFPSLIGVVTSSTGAALQDILNTLRSRYPLAQVLLSPTLVQGEEAPRKIVQALHLLQNAPTRPDIIILARGGGSLEDLWSFNDENVVRAVAASSIPIISGVGHETDFTLVDFAADLRAPTPTGAAVLAVPNIQDLKLDLQDRRSSLASLAGQLMQMKTAEVKELHYRLLRNSPERLLQQHMLQLDEVGRRLQYTLYSGLAGFKADVGEKRARLLALDPAAVLQRGYALLHDSHGKLIDSVSKTGENEMVGVRLKDGSLQAQITAVEKDNGTGK
jgi:exodeoxyribonuclease VII large subunit